MLDWLAHIAVAIAVSILIITFIAQITRVYGPSMMPTLLDGDRLIMEKISPRLGNIHRGDIVVIDVPEFAGKERNPIIKRVIGVGNDTVEIKGGKVYVNGNALVENYVGGEVTSGIDPRYSYVRVPEGEIYVLGDNRDQSMDSRMIGPQKIKSVRGRAVFRIFPLDRAGFIR